jgi:hypothetical protein
MSLEKELFCLDLKKKNNMAYFKIVLLIMAVLLLNKQMVIAKNNRQFVTGKEWVKYSKAYDYTENYKTQKKSKNLSANKKFALPSFFSFFPYIVYILVALLVITIIAIIVMLILDILKHSKETLSNTKKYNVTTYENIENADFENDLQQILSKGLYKQALRIKYLIVLKTLTSRQLIAWKIDKTNGNYLQEMYGKNGFDTFRNITISFERVWYGDIQITEKEYLQLIPIFDQIDLIACQ